MLPQLPARSELQRWILLLVLVPAATFALSLGNEFVLWDDYGLIVDNPIVQTISPATIGRAFTTYDPELYIPLTLLSYQFDHLIGGFHPAVFHAHNLLLHIINVLLVAWLLFLLTSKKAAAVFGALLFAVHPLHVETVVWASARKDLLSAAYFLLAVIAYVYAQERGSRRLWILSVAAFALGLLSKVMVITLPFVLLLIDWRNGRLAWRAVAEKWPCWILAALFAAIAFFGKQEFLSALSFQELLLTSAKATVFYLQKYIVPWGLSAVYPHTDAVTFAHPALIGALALVALITGGAWYASKRWHRDILFGWLWFLACLGPTFFLYRRGEHLGDIHFASDRYVYLAGIGLLLIDGLIFAALLRRWGTRPLLAAGGVVIVVLAVLSVRQSLTWRTTETLFFNVLRHYPNSHVAHLNIGNHYQRLGDFNEAVREYQESLNIRPTSLTYFNVGKALLELGFLDEALDANARALRLDPALAIAQLQVGVVHVRKGNTAQAIDAFEKALVLDPQSVEARFNLGAMYEKAGRVQEAIVQYEAAVELQRNLVPGLVRLAGLAAANGNNDIASAYVARVLAIDPGNKEAVALQNQMTR